MARSSTDQLPFRYRPADSELGVSRATARRLAELLGVDETAMIHLALRRMAQHMLPQYEQDDGPLSEAQLRRLRSAIPQEDERRVIRSSLFGQARKKKAAA